MAAGAAAAAEAAGAGRISRSACSTGGPTPIATARSRPRSAPAKGGSWNVPVNYTFNKWGTFNTLNVQYNRAKSESTNLYAYQTDVAGEAGIVGVSTDPFSWGIPSLSLTSVSGLRDQSPTIRTDQTLTISMNQMKPWKRHSFRWGGDFRWMLTDSRTDSNPRGSFVFTGRLHGLHRGAGRQHAVDGGHGAGLRGLPARHVAAGDAELRAGHDPVPVARVEPVLPGRLARERQVHDQRGRALRVPDAVLGSEQQPRQPGRERGLHGGRAGPRRPERAVHGRSSRPAPWTRIGTTSRRARASRGG